MKGKRVLKKQIKPNQGLLSTYFISLLSMVLCFIMLFGTTFAWFYTDNTSLGNEIHSGILKVDMLHVTEGGNKKISLAEQNDNYSVFSSDDLWTPDRSTRMETVEIVNTGNVTLDYKLDFVPLEKGDYDPETAKLFSVYVNGTKQGDTLYQFLSDADDETDDIYLIAQQELGRDDDPHSVQIELRMDGRGAHNHMGQRVPVYLKLEAYQHLTGTSE